MRPGDPVRVAMLHGPGRPDHDGVIDDVALPRRLAAVGPRLAARHTWQRVVAARRSGYERALRVCHG